MSPKLFSALVLSTLILSACALPTAFPPPIATAAATEMSAAASTAPEAVDVESSSGLPAQRIISLAPSNTEILFAIGASEQMVGRDSFSDYPAEAAQVADIGGGFAALNMELIVSKQPDLILTAPLTPPEQIADLKNLGLTVYVVPNPATFDDLYANLETVADLTGHQSEAQALVASLKARVNAIINQVAMATETPLVYYELDATDPNAPFTSGPGTFVHLVIESAGGVNFGAEIGDEWVQVSVEQLLARQPDVIVLGDHTYGGVTPEQVRMRTGWDALTAVKDNRIFIFDDNLVSRPGPRLVDGLETMAKLLHPDLVR